MGLAGFGTGQDPRQLLLVHRAEAGDGAQLGHSLAREGFVVTSVCEEQLGPAVLEQPFDGAVLSFFEDRDSFVAMSRTLRNDGGVPIAVVADDLSPDEIVGVLDAGGDDCLRFSQPPEVLAARLRSLLRRWCPDDDRLVMGSVELDRAGLRVTRAGEPVDLSKTELDLFLALAREPGWVYPRERLMQEIWGYDCSAAQALRTAVKRLRMKIEDDPARPEIVKTARGIGYFLDC